MSLIRTAYRKWNCRNGTIVSNVKEEKAQSIEDELEKFKPNRPSVNRELIKIYPIFLC